MSNTKRKSCGANLETADLLLLLNPPQPSPSIEKKDRARRKEGGRRRKEEGGRRKEEVGRKKDEGGRRKEEGGRKEE